MSIESLKTEPLRPTSLSARAESRGVSLAFLAVLAASFLVAYLPTYLRLAAGAWRTEQEGHGPLIMLAAVWLAWQQRDKLRTVELRPAPVAGWDHFAPLPPADGRHAVTRHPDDRGCDANPGAFGMPAARRRLVAGPHLRLSACLSCLLDTPAELAPRRVHRTVEGMDFPISFPTLFTISAYPVAQNGAMIMIGSYELMVKDACSGMNSIFALSAIGVFLYS